MKTRFVALLVCALLAFAFRHDMPRILIIGDSISIGYTPFVKSHFEGRAVVVHNPGNAEHTGTGLARVRDWVGKEDWDIIQFNWGLWDLCYRHPDSEVQGNRDKVNGTLTLSVEAYRNNLDSIVTLLKQETDAALVFVTTTYVPENEAGRYPEDARIYNAAAKQVMEKHGVAVNDIYETSKAIHRRWGKGTDDVHYTEAGYSELSKPVVAFLEQTLRSLN